ncbi:peroxidase superfamily protein [Tasmannia lanceolata]|uniref:peroxidase superfamily protein n=1 Tax=Tasmannia lanceolata TaxID=3420 RepID=UPI004063E08C
MMAVSYFLELILLINFIIFSARFSVDALSIDYYALRCPFVEVIVRDTVHSALHDDPTLAGPLLRMHFHDCFVEGCDGSVLIDTTKGNKAEKDSPANLSLRGYEIIDQAKARLEDQCPGVVSCADIVAMAARDAVLWTHGPLYDIPKGRKDGRRSKIEDTFKLPAPIFNSSTLIRMFGQHGFSAQELVALSGAHTLGVARCASFKNRLKNFDSTNNVDPSLDSDFARALAKTCSAGDNAEVSFDGTRTEFDNAYYNAIQSASVLLTSDQTLYTDLRTRRFVNNYGMNTAMFFLDFTQAMVKMGQLDVKEGAGGEVRQNCHKIN